MRLTRFPPFALFLGLGILQSSGCKAPETWAAEADEQSYDLIEARRAQLFADETEFSIEPLEGSLRERILAGEVLEIPPLRLIDCLEIAAENSREYQSRKERLFLAALDLTLEQWHFEIQYGASASTSLNGDGNSADNASVDGGLTLSRLLGSGARIVANIGTSLFRVVSGSDGWDAVGDLGLTFTQPLLRGSGRAIVEEPLTQAQRDLLYEVRDFERFRREFAVDVARQYYRLLQSLDNVQNQVLNSDSIAGLRARNEARAKAGRLSDIEVDQARQEELVSQNSLIQLQQSFAAQIDDLKIFLGLPVEIEVTLDLAEAERLASQVEDASFEVSGIDEDAAIDFAFASRLDFLNTADSLTDAERRTAVTADALRMGLDFDASVSAASPEGRPFEFRSDNVGWSAGLSLDLPIDMIPERNAYRRSLIALESARRTVDQQGDTIRANLRDQVRRVASGRQSWLIERNSVALAERRVESARLNLEAGRTDTQNVLLAEESLLRARNGLVRSMVDFSLSRLDFYLEIELLSVDESGIIVDNELLAALLETDE